MWARLALRAGVRQNVESMEHAIQRLEQEDPRRFSREQFFDEEYERIPRWNIVSRLLFPNFFEVSIKGAKHELDIDLTARILELRSLVADCQRQAVVLPRPAPSPVAEISWHYELTDEGLLIRASDSLPIEGRFRLPLEFRVEVPPECRRKISI